MNVMMSVNVQWQAAEAVVGRLHAAGFEGFLVGGAVRDILLQREPKDFDVVTNATPEQLEQIQGFEQASYTDPAQAFGVTRVKVPVEGEMVEIEVTTYRRDVEAHLGRKLTKVAFSHIEDDLERRDFTINALALDPHNHFLVDLHDGLADLDAKTVRFIGDPAQRIVEDPLRILRAVRFRNQLGFTYDPDTEAAIKQAVAGGKVADIAVDRLFSELTQMLLHESRRQAIEDLDELGVLERILPEVTAMKGVMQPKDEHSEGDVWTHTMLAIDALVQPSVRLAWATLLHDVGKTPTYEAPEGDDDRIRFDNHFRVGGEMARAILQRLKVSKALTDDVVWLVHYHLITDSFPRMKRSRMHHYMSHPAFHDLLDLHAADMRGSVAARPEDDRDDELIAELEQKWQDYKQQSTQNVPTLKETLGIDGHWLKREFDITDGHELGRILDELKDDFLDGEITNEDDVREKVNKLIDTSRT